MREKSDSRQSMLNLSLFVVFFFAVLLMSGIHQGFLVLVTSLGLSDMLQVFVPIIYWAVVALGFTAYTHWRVNKVYNEPIRMMAEATAKVAGGDFSVFIPPEHTKDKTDYLDVMFQDFNKMVEELGSIETLKIDFFSNVSHEIKTPIAVIQNHAYLLQNEDLTEEERKDYTDTILQATKKLSNLITNMLKLNKLEKQTIKPMPQVYDLCAQICDAALQFEDIWEEKQIELIADIEEKVDIVADEGLLELVWTNLISNAMKFTPSGGTVSISMVSDKDTVKVSVADTGCGMDEQTKKKVFEKFYQGDTSHSTEGNGLGLSLVKRIVDLSDGEIFVESVPGKGSVFTVVLPMKNSGEED